MLAHPVPLVCAAGRLLFPGWQLPLWERSEVPEGQEPSREKAESPGGTHSPRWTSAGAKSSANPTASGKTTQGPWFKSVPGSEWWWCEGLCDYNTKLIPFFKGSIVKSGCGWLVSRFLYSKLHTSLENNETYQGPYYIPKRLVRQPYTLFTVWYTFSLLGVCLFIWKIAGVIWKCVAS